MAKKIVVNENEDVKVISKVTKLVTRLSNGENCTWVPEDEIRLIGKSIIKDGDYIASKDVGAPYGYSQVTVNGIGNKILGQLGEKNITKNGTYIAEDDSDGPYYGYSKVIVNIEKSDGGGSPVVGKDEDGDDAVPKIDDDGHIVTEKLPTRISISVYPNNLVYEDGQAIDFTGLRVKAFLPDDTEWGVVTDEELIKPVRVAAADLDGNREEYTIEDKSIISHPNDLNLPLITESSLGYQSDIVDAVITTNAGLLLLINDVVYCFSKTPATVTMIQTLNSTGKQSTYTDSTRHSVKTRVSETQVYYTNPYSIPAGSTRIGTNNTVNFTGGGGEFAQYMRDIATVLFDGNGYQGSQQTIPLQWKRPGDGKVLETSFTIAVHESSDGDNNTSGGNVTPGNQNIDVPQ